MKISNTLINYLNISHTTINSEIIVTNRKSIIYSSVSNYLNLNISKPLFSILKNWESDSIKNISLIISQDFLQLYEGDVSNYTGQMIFPIIHNGQIDGLLIFFRRYQNFIESSKKYGMSIKHFVEIFSDNNFIDKT